MPSRESVAVEVTERQQSVMESLVRAKSTPQQLAERCRIVLMSAEGRPTVHQADELGVDRQRVRRWRHRWATASDALAAAEKEGANDKDFKALILRVLTDEPRSGAPPKFSPEQVAAIIALACEPPADSGRPVSHWTPGELAADAIAAALEAGNAHIRDQLRRASDSIVNNISEGAGEFQPGEKARFYRIALRSATESAATLHTCQRRKIANLEAVEHARVLLKRVVEMLTRLVRKVSKRRQGRQP